MDGVFGEHAGVFEHDRPDRCLTSPLRELLVCLAGRAEAVHRGGPTCVRPGPPIERGERPHRLAIIVSSLFEGF